MTNAAELAASRIGTTLRGKWRVDRLLGVGATAAVYAATHRNGAPAALKVLHAECSAQPQIRERFLREGYVANAIRHPGAIAVLDDDECDDGSAFLVLELLDGETVETRWEQRGNALPLAEVLAIGDQLLDVLTAAHAAGIVHRDVKPDNLFLTRDGALKVLDFGIASGRRQATDAWSTESGAAMGTPAFMPPEQALGHWDEVDARSDLWSVGATLFTLLSGHYVHDAETAGEMLLAVMTHPPPSLATVAPHAPPELVAVIDRALRPNREERFATAAEMRQAIRAVPGFRVDRRQNVVSARVLSSEPPAAVLPARAPRNDVWIATAAMLVACAASLGFCSVRNGTYAGSANAAVVMPAQAIATFSLPPDPAPSASAPTAESAAVAPARSAEPRRAGPMPVYVARPASEGFDDLLKARR